MKLLPKTILVPIDFSDPSKSALDYAMDLAEKLGAKVYALHAYEIPIISFPDGAYVATSDVACRIIDGANKGLSDATAKYAGRDVVLTPMLKQGDPREVILEVARDVTADLVVMGTHGRRGIARALVGSVTESLVRISPVPVLTVHGPTPQAAGAKAATVSF